MRASWLLPKANSIAHPLLRFGESPFANRGPAPTATMKHVRQAVARIAIRPLMVRISLGQLSWDLPSYKARTRTIPPRQIAAMSMLKISKHHQRTGDLAILRGMSDSGADPEEVAVSSTVMFSLPESFAPCPWGEA
jgi:hypothetical protein